MASNTIFTNNTELAKLNFNIAKVLVVGDGMLDKYWHVNTRRISDEAPVPIVRVMDTENRLGGAANVAANLVALGARVKLLTAVGVDQNADSLIELLDAKDIPHNLAHIENFSTIVKLRVLCKQQQMIRLDHEDELENLRLDELKQIYDIYAKEIFNYNIVILSDYAKGVLHNPRPYIQTAVACGVPVIVDPKNNDFNLYRDSYIVKPNLLEFERIVGKCANIEILVERARNLINNCGIKNLIITRGSAGMTVVPSSGEASHIPAYSGEVYDVTGAGDTVISVLAAAVSSNIDLVKAARISSIAASIAVSKVGTASVSVHEIKKAMHTIHELPLGIQQVEGLAQIIAQAQARGEKVVFANGCYDLIHFGHIRFLERAKELGDRLVVGINTDDSIRRSKGPNRPLYTLEQRMEVLSALDVVDWVVPFSEDRPGKLVEALNPDVLVKGDEHFKTVNDIPPGEGVEHVLARGGSVHLIGRTQGCSSSQTIELLNN